MVNLRVRAERGVLGAAWATTKDGSFEARRMRFVKKSRKPLFVTTSVATRMMLAVSPGVVGVP